MTVDPVVPPLALAVAAVAVFALRAVALVQLNRSGGGWRATLRWATTTVAVALVLFAAARPGTTSGPAADAAPVDENVYFVVDRSADSAIGDFGESARMAGIRADINALVSSHPGARFALITFTSRPEVRWPLSPDVWSLGPVVDALRPGTDPAAAASQANATAAANVLRYQLIAGRQRYPRAEQLVYYFGSGAPSSTTPQGVFDPDGVDAGAVLGYGAAGGTALAAIADQLGVPYVARRPGAAPPVAAETASPAMPPPTEPAPRSERYWLLTMLASVLLLIEITLSVRDLRRLTYRGMR